MKASEIVFLAARMALLVCFCVIVFSERYAFGAYIAVGFLILSALQTAYQMLDDLGERKRDKPEQGKRK